MSLVGCSASSGWFYHNFQTLNSRHCWTFGPSLVLSSEYLLLIIQSPPTSKISKMSLKRLPTSYIHTTIGYPWSSQYFQPIYRTGLFDVVWIFVPRSRSPKSFKRLKNNQQIINIPQPRLPKSKKTILHTFPFPWGNRWLFDVAMIWPTWQSCLTAFFHSPTTDFMKSWWLGCWNLHMLGSKIPLHTCCRCFLIIVFVVETMTAKQSELVLMSFLYHRLTFL